MIRHLRKSVIGFFSKKGRIDSLGATDSPSACFQSAFAREVVQNTRRSSSTVVQESHVNHHGHHSVMGSNPMMIVVIL